MKNYHLRRLSFFIYTSVQSGSGPIGVRAQKRLISVSSMHSSLFCGMPSFNIHLAEPLPCSFILSVFLSAGASSNFWRKRSWPRRAELTVVHWMCGLWGRWLCSSLLIWSTVKSGYSLRYHEVSFSCRRPASHFFSYPSSLDVPLS